MQDNALQIGHYGKITSPTGVELPSLSRELFLDNDHLAERYPLNIECSGIVFVSTKETDRLLLLAAPAWLIPHGSVSNINTTFFTRASSADEKAYPLESHLFLERTLGDLVPAVLD